MRVSEAIFKKCVKQEDDANKTILSSFDKKTGKIFSFVDFECQKSGIYQISYDFRDGQQGSAVGVVSMIK